MDRAGEDAALMLPGTVPGQGGLIPRIFTLRATVRRMGTEKGHVTLTLSKDYCRI